MKSKTVPAQPINKELKESTQAQKFLGKRSPANTGRASKNGFRLLAQFVMSLVSDPSPDSQYSDLAGALTSTSVREIPGSDNVDKSFMSVLLRENTSSSGLDERTQCRLRRFLVEFGTRYVSQRTNKEVLPSTMLTYLRVIQCRLSELRYGVNVLSGPIFDCPTNVLKSALDNMFAQQQAQGGTSKCHNVLTIDDVQRIFESEYCSVGHITGFRNRSIFSVGLALGTRPTELWRLDVAQFVHETVNGKESLVFYPKVGSALGESKNAQGGIRAVRYRNRFIPIHDVTFLPES